MGRFFNTSSPQYLQGVQYELPVDMMMRVIQNDNQLRASIEKEAQAKELQLLQQQALSFDNEALERVKQSYQSDIDSIAQSVYNDPDAINVSRGKMRDLQKRMILDTTDGELGAISGRYNAFTKFQQDNKDIMNTDPDTYQAAMAYELNKLASETAKNSKASFSPYKIIGRPEFRKDLFNEMTKLKESKRTIPDGKGRLIKMSELSEDRLRDLALSHILNKPEYQGYARQQTMYGRRGFMNEDGSMTSPFVYVAPNGQILNNEQLSQLPAEARKQVRRSFNPNWAFGNELESMARSVAYRQDDLANDAAYQAQADRAQRMAMHREKMAIEQLKLQERMSRGSGGSSGGNKNGKKDSLKGVIETDGVHLINHRTQLNYSHDLANAGKGNGAVDERIKNVGWRLSNEANKGIPMFGSMIRRINGLGVDLSDPKSEEAKKAIFNEMTALAKSKNPNEIITFNGINYRAEDVANNKYEFTANIAKGILEQTAPVAKKIINDVYKEYNDTEQSTTGYIINKSRASNMLLNIESNVKELNIWNSNEGRFLTDGEKKSIFTDMDNLEVSVIPGTNSNTGWAANIRSRKENEPTNNYLVTSANMSDILKPHGDLSIALSTDDQAIKDMFRTRSGRWNAQDKFSGNQGTFWFREGEDGDVTKLGYDIGIPNLADYFDDIKVKGNEIQLRKNGKDIVKTTLPGIYGGMNANQIGTYVEDALVDYIKMENEKAQKKQNNKKK